LLDKDDLERILVETSYPMERAGMMERERQRHFLLRYLEQRKNEDLEAVVLHRFPRFHLVRIEEYVLNAALYTANSVTLNPYDRVLVRIEKIRPREDQLSLSLVKIL
jgi:exoribonuclease-2